MACCGGKKTKNDHFSTFSDAAYNGNIDKMRECLKKEAKSKKNKMEDVINEKHGDFNMTALHFAVQKKGNIEAVKFLIQNQANVKAQTKNGETPLHIACYHRNEEAVKELLTTEARQDVNTAEKLSGMTPLHIAVCKGSPGVIDLLLQNGADPKIKDKNGHDCFDSADFWANQDTVAASPNANHSQAYDVLKNAMRA
ncbi:ankyrin repeat protein [Gregarina niphandrodes]|uniref:Ankyrin repeat protein n=1 Tax=Gregarina niphandrodes TaxID=110365 RepID=A0A023B1W9_GRENI|nr:ankyrin repeat protein [Gregarina niphandrodes]EZG48220.1 ankyrin repeat protein [Gregarina niphandrodes]|eukprot:XP_011132116.1 ankyrin repeat protein [Gregarina niphandrodes]